MWLMRYIRWKHIGHVPSTKAIATEWKSCGHRKPMVARRPTNGTSNRAWRPLLASAGHLIGASTTSNATSREQTTMSYRRLGQKRVRAKLVMPFDDHDFTTV